MTPEQALALLDQVSGQILCTREQHMQIQQAVNILKERIMESPKEEQTEDIVKEE